MSHKHVVGDFVYTSSVGYVTVVGKESCDIYIAINTSVLNYVLSRREGDYL